MDAIISLLKPISILDFIHTRTIYSLEHIINNLQIEKKLFPSLYKGSLFAFKSGGTISAKLFRKCFLKSKSVFVFK